MWVFTAWVQYGGGGAGLWEPHVRISWGQVCGGGGWVHNPSMWWAGLTLCRCGASRNLPHCHPLTISQSSHTHNCQPLKAHTTRFMADCDCPLWHSEHNVVDPPLLDHHRAPHWLILEVQPVKLDLGILDGSSPADLDSIPPAPLISKIPAPYLRAAALC